MLNATHRLLSRFCNNRSGNIAILFSIALLPIAAAIGAALDYSYASMARSKLNAAADAAALAAVSHAAMAGTTSEAHATATSIFNADATGIVRLTIDNLSIDVTDHGGNRTAVVNYSAEVPTAILGIMGKNTITIGGTATAASAIPAYIDFYLLLDNTPSMGVAATPADIFRMVNNTPDQCAFACHETQKQNDYYQLAKQLGVTMRIDVVREATQTMLDRAMATQVLPRQFRTALYTFGFDASKRGLTRISPLTAAIADVKKSANQIDLMTVPRHGYDHDAHTDFFDLLTAVNREIRNPGPGTSPSRPQKVLFFVSDGLHNSVHPPICTKQQMSSGRCQQPLHTSVCTTIKNRGIRIAVLYTTYLPLPTNPFYNNWIAPFQDEIGPAMRACASPGPFFEVGPGEGITEAMLALFQEAVAQAHLTR